MSNLENFTYILRSLSHCMLASRKVLISSSLHYKECLIREVAHLTPYITQRGKVIGLTRFLKIYVPYTSRLIRT
jgi:hypothetical protein